MILCPAGPCPKGPARGKTAEKAGKKWVTATVLWSGLKYRIEYARALQGRYIVPVRVTATEVPSGRTIFNATATWYVSTSSRPK